MKTTFDPTRGLIVVSCRITGPAGDTIVRLALDTGATSTMVNWDVLVLLGYDPAAFRDRIQITTGSGLEFVPRISVSRIEALGRNVENLAVLAHTLPPTAMVDGLLGLDFLRDACLTIDFTDGTIEL